LLCNAEDRRCMEEKHSEDFCAECCVPICCSCKKALRSSPPVMPVRALANNLWTGFAAPMLAAEKVTYLECMLASPCMLCLMCFSLETQYGNVYLEKAQQQTFRVGARGNITLFPLPLEEIMAERRKQAGEEQKLRCATACVCKRFCV
jgi:hypothetical protein